MLSRDPLGLGRRRRYPRTGRSRPSAGSLKPSEIRAPMLIARQQKRPGEEKGGPDRRHRCPSRGVVVRDRIGQPKAESGHSEPNVR
jgi:hypothetical protein